MRKQKKIWQEEHSLEKALPSIGFQQEPSGLVKTFIKFLKENNVKPPLKLIDIGCGKGRNSLYLAKEGFEVYAVDYILAAIKDVNLLAKQTKMEANIHASVADIDKKWPFLDNFFDLAIDCFSSIDIETQEGREVYRNELLRTLKPNGYAMVSVVSAKDEVEKKLMEDHPGEEKNSVYWPANGKFQKNYDEKELHQFYRDFKIVSLQEITKPAFKLNRHYTATNFLVILQKPNDEK